MHIRAKIKYIFTKNKTKERSREGAKERKRRKKTPFPHEAKMYIFLLIKLIKMQQVGER